MHFAEEKTKTPSIQMSDEMWMCICIWYGWRYTHIEWASHFHVAILLVSMMLIRQKFASLFPISQLNYSIWMNICFGIFVFGIIIRTNSVVFKITIIIVYAVRVFIVCYIENFGLFIRNIYCSVESVFNITHHIRWW